MRRSVMALLSLAAATAPVAAATWSEIAPLPRGLAGHAAAATAGGLLIAGGTYWDGEGRRFDPRIQHRAGRESWRTVGVLKGGYAYGGAAVGEGALWLAGGLGETGPLDLVRRIDLATGVVTDVARLPQARVNCGAALLGNALWVLGGTPRDGDFSRATPTWWRIDLGTGRVQEVAPAGPTWINPLVLALGADLHVLPGSVWSAERKRLEPPTQAWIYRTASQEWERRPLPPGVARGMSGIALDHRYALVAGGVEVRAGAIALSHATWLYDAVEGQLRPGTPLPSPRLAAAMARGPDSVFLIGGEDRARSRSAGIWELPVASGTARKAGK